MGDSNGTFTTNSKAKIEFLIPELNNQRLINAYVHDTSSEMSYDMIIGQDLMQELGIDVLNSTKTINAMIKKSTNILKM